MITAGLTISSFGDNALIVDLGNVIDETLNSQVLQLFHKLRQANLPFVKDIVPAYSSLVIFYDLLILANTLSLNRTATQLVMDEVKKVIDEDIKISQESTSAIKIPVCYSSRYAWDIGHIATLKKISPGDVIRLHTGRTYRVYMNGFLPGFPYLGEVDQRIAVPRKVQPRIKVEAGAVGIAGLQTGIYPFDSPGGWQIIGKTPLRIFDPEKTDPVLLHPGDTVEFYSITEDEFENY